MQIKIIKRILATVLRFLIISQGLSSNFDNAVNKFAVSVYTNVIKNNYSNVLVSTAAIQDALALLFTGSNGQTTTDLAKGLNFGKATKNQATKAFHKFLRNIRKLDKTATTFDIANKFYSNQKYKIKNEFKHDACELYSSVEPIDFANTTAASMMINTWASNHTNNQIQNFMSLDNLGPATNLVIVSAGYFNGILQQQFPVFNSVFQIFHAIDGSMRDVFLMQNVGYYMFGFIDSLAATAVSIPYNNSDVTMLILLPNTTDGLSALEARLTTFDLTTIDSQLRNESVMISIPSINVDFEIDLANVLTEMGMGIIYSNQADFSGIHSDKARLKVSSYVHRAVITLKPTGIDDLRPIQVNKIFTTASPFIFILRKGVDIICIGRFADPYKRK